MNFNIKDILTGDNRTAKAKVNILFSLGLKGIDALVYVLIVPVTLDYLNPYEYGIWLTLSSILMWINSFDIGLGNGMRNKLATALAKNDKKLGRAYVSTTFFMLVIIMGIIIGIGSICSNYLNWYDILNTTPANVSNLGQIVYVSFFFFCINFIFKFIGSVYLAMQLPAVNNLLVVSGNFMALIIIFILTKYTVGNLLWVALAFSVSPLIIYLLAYPITFGLIFPYLRPSIRFFRLNYLKDLFNIGVQFFILQLSAILLFSVTNLIISHMFGPEEVTPYNVSYRYFSVVLMVMNLLLAPMWSATTDAYAKGDMPWIQRIMKNLKKILCFISLGIVIMVLMSNMVYRIWIGNEVSIPMTLSILMGIYVCILIWSLTYSNILNGLGKLRIQMINTVCVALLNIPFCFVLGKLWGIYGIVLSLCLLNLSGLLLNKIQLSKIIEKRATGIWCK